MVTNYQKGYAFELKCRDYWRRKGWSCDRTPASKTPYDLTCVRKTADNHQTVLRVQCQKHLPFSRKKIDALIQWCGKESSHPLLMWGNGKVNVKHAIDYMAENVYKIHKEVG